VAGVFGAWSATVCERKRQKAVVSRVVQRLRSGGLLLAFERWVHACAELRQERAAAESTQLSLARLREQQLRLSKIERIKRGLFARASRICSLSYRCLSYSLRFRLFRKWRLYVRLQHALCMWSFGQSCRFFLLWRQALPQLRIESKSERVTQEKIIKKFIPARSWR
jgi:uncharacterized protein YybS (DUF2232 family)